MKGKNMNLAFGLEKIYEDAEFQIGDLDKVVIVGIAASLSCELKENVTYIKRKQRSKI